ncbi:GH12 family glycosyl hydrolase domain-containing protein (plasmid) [Streptomyces sp. CA-294286]|uniref:GH12 family glycosyl hydrolase domain-containing protein n=1 Tax=Streptomyces sp. CA-294286 TaxID=3240070 RepID=UPI003D91F690
MRPLLPRLRTALLTSLTTLASLAALTTATGVAQAEPRARAAAPAADTRICDTFGTATLQGRYTVQNNRWGTGATQCVDVTPTGFELTRADGSVPTNGPPKSYPSVFNGCHYTTCSPGTNLPARLSSISSAPSTISYGYVNNAVYNASYDIWLDPTPKRDGVNRTEIMIWFHRVGPVQPIGSPVGTASVGGRTWEVWSGNNGGNDVLSFVAPAAIPEWSFDVMDFVDETVARGLAEPSWYLTSVQAGFEPWADGAGLAVRSFSSAVHTGGTAPDPGTPTPAACQVRYAAQSWPGGFVADVTLTHTAATPIDGWQAAFTLPEGQSVSHAWNATLSPAAGAVTAVPTASNARIPANGGTSFGFQGTYTGTFAKPSGFTLNGAVCTVS